jgi:hypothetical protein
MVADELCQSIASSRALVESMHLQCARYLKIYEIYKPIMIWLEQYCALITEHVIPAILQVNISRPSCSP